MKPLTPAERARRYRRRKKAKACDGAVDNTIPRQPSRRTVRKSGKPFTDTERKRRWRANKRAREKAEAKAARRAAIAAIVAELGIHRIAVADISEDQLASESVDAIMTDPPYGEAYGTCGRDLGVFAMRVLKPSGWCAALVGTGDLARVLADLGAAGLCYRWTIAVSFPGGPTPKFGGMRVFAGWKPVVICQKPPRSPPPSPHWNRDDLRIPAADYDKSEHPWQAPQRLFEDLVERFTLCGQLVVDPFAGTGTTLKAAHALGRHAWGADDGSADHLGG
jgi:hypothetical protein